MSKKSTNPMQYKVQVTCKDGTTKSRYFRNFDSAQSYFYEVSSDLPRGFRADIVDRLSGNFICGVVSRDVDQFSREETRSQYSEYVSVEEEGKVQEDPEIKLNWFEKLIKKIFKK